MYQLKGISCYAKILIDKGELIDKKIVEFVENSLFTTLTNVNFDAEVHVELLKESQEIKEALRKKVKHSENYPVQATYNLSNTKEEMLKEEKKAEIMYDQDIDADIRSLRQTIIYGLKGISAYGHQARVINYNSEQVDQFYFLGPEANTTTYENPTPHMVNVHVKKGPFIIVSGHDLKDLQMLLEQTEGKGINIYTHGEMIPAHGYPELKKYKHLIGNFGGAWQDQQSEFDNIPGCILMTTNCLMKPRPSYKDRIFTTSVVGWDAIKYIPRDKNGYKDFSEIIDKALELGGFEEDEEKHEILVGFGHKATLSHANEIVSAVKEGKIKHFLLIGGCDGARPGRNYYTDFAKMVPQDCIILTLACGKYRFNKLNFGEVADLLALLSLGIKGMFLGPTLPAFISQNVLQYLVDTFNIRPISTPEDDLKTCLRQLTN